MSIQRKLQKIYARIPEIECKGLCQECCGPIMMSDAEEHVIRTAGHAVPDPLKVIFSKDARCPHLKAGQCGIYDLRPAICRLWGAEENMKCPHGCKPDRYLTKKEGFEILNMASKIPSPGEPCAKT